VYSILISNVCCAVIRIVQILYCWCGFNFSQICCWSRSSICALLLFTVYSDIYVTSTPRQILISYYLYLLSFSNLALLVVVYYLLFRFLTCIILLLLFSSCWRNSPSPWCRLSSVASCVLFLSFLQFCPPSLCAVGHHVAVFDLTKLCFLWCILFLPGLSPILANLKLSVTLLTNMVRSVPSFLTKFVSHLLIVMYSLIDDCIGF